MRQLNDRWRRVIVILSFGLIAFQLYTAVFGVFIDLVQRSVHMLFIMLLALMKRAPGKRLAEKETAVPWYDLILCALSAGACLFILIHSRELTANGLFWIGPFGGRLDIFFAVAMVLICMEISRRIVGWIFPAMTILLFIYSRFGIYFGDFWGHANIPTLSILQQLYHTTTGIWGAMIGLSAGMLAMFSIFGEMLGNTGGALSFIKLGKKLTNNSTGGSGKVALISSGLFGMISGSSVAIVLATGTFTIPMMEKDGFRKEWAGAISAVGSTGGQMMPPVMGSGAFIMAQLLSIPYMIIARSAIVPAALYYFGALVAIHFTAKKYGIRGKKEDIRFSLQEILVILLPLATFLALLLNGYTVTRGALIATAVSFITCVLSYGMQGGTNKTAAVVSGAGKLVFDTTVNAGSTIVKIAGLLVGSQIVVSLISFCGFGVKLSSLIVMVGRGNLFLCLLLSLVVCLVLGMGMPTTAAYVLGTAVLVPPLVNLGLAHLTAHLFVFFFACISSITPPVCSAVFAASGLAESDWWKTGWLSVAIALPAFIVPFTLAYNPALILQGTPAEVTISVITAVIGAFAIGTAVAGYFRRHLNPFFRAVLIAGGIMMVVPSMTASAAGLVMCAAVLAGSSYGKIPGRKYAE